VIETNLNITSEEAAAILTCLEYFILNDLKDKETHRKGPLPDYEPISNRMGQILNELRSKLIPIVKEGK
jgi:hypothetical protein